MKMRGKIQTLMTGNKVGLNRIENLNVWRREMEN